MANWHYYNENGEKIGPIRGRELKRLAQQGTITPETRVEDENGQTALAKNVTGLTFAETAQSDSMLPESSTVLLPPSAESENGANNTAENLGEQDFEQLREDFERLQKQQEQGTQNITPPPPVEVNPFTATISAEPNPFAATPAESNPFTAHIPRGNPPDVLASTTKENRKSFGETMAATMRYLMSLIASMTGFVLVMLLCGVVAIVLLWLFHITNPHVPLPYPLNQIFQTQPPDPTPENDENVPPDADIEREEDVPREIAGVQRPGQADAPADPSGGVVEEQPPVQGFVHEEPPNGSVPPPPPQPDRRTILAGATDLLPAMRDAGFNNDIRSFANFGSSALRAAHDSAIAARNRIPTSDEIRRIPAQQAVDREWARILAERSAILQRTFFNEYTYSASNERHPVGGPSSFTMRISTGFFGGENVRTLLSFPFPGVTGTVSSSPFGGVTISVSGPEGSIRELVNNRSVYEVRMWFNTLQHGNNAPTANIQRISIVRVGSGPCAPLPPPPPPPPRIVQTVLYPYTVAASPDGDNSRIIRISATRTNPNARFTQPRADVVSFPPELNVTNVAITEQGRLLEITVNGQEDDIRGLVSNTGNWQIRVGFGPSRRNPDGTETADALTIELTN